MRFLVTALLLFALAVGLGILLRFNHGNVAILWPPYRLDVSVNFALLVLLGAFILSYFLIRAVLTTARLPTVVRQYRDEKTRTQAVKSLGESVVAFFEGRFGKAERLAERARQSPELDAAACLVAARSAHRMRESFRRDNWLSALEDEGKHDLARYVMQAEFYLDDQASQEALEALEKAKASGGRHLYQLRLALRAYEQSENWPALLRTVGQLEKRDALPEAVIRGLRNRAWRARLKSLDDSPERLKLLIKEAGDQLDETALAEPLVDALRRCKMDAAAADYIDKAMRQEFSASLVLRYASLSAPSNKDRLRNAEAWLAKYGEEPALLEALGRLCAEEALWGKAEEFLQRAQRKGAGPGASLALAAVYEKIGRPFDASGLYKSIAMTRQT